jgi:putative SOS response-associated peptidase YedK
LRPLPSSWETRIPTERDQFSRWLDPSTPPADASKILACYRSRLKADAVSKAVLNARNEYPELLTPIAS